MPTQVQVQNTILSAQYKLATYVNTNLNLINSGNLPQNEDTIDYLNLNLLGLEFQANRPDYVSDTTVTIYNRLLGLIGIDTTNNNLDPNFQNPAQVIQIILPASYISPIDVPWDMFDPATEQPDGGRSIYFNSDWKGLNPFLSLITPGEIALELGIDYTLVPSGGIALLSGSVNLPFIYEGQVLRSVAYAVA